MDRLKVEDRKCSFKAEDSYYDDANTIAKGLNQVTTRFQDATFLKNSTLHLILLRELELTHLLMKKLFSKETYQN